MEKAAPAPRSEPGLDPAFIERLAEPYRKVRAYCRVTVEGLEHVPPGKAVIVANHTGWNGLDYANLFLTLYDDLGRVMHTAVHPAFFRMPLLGRLAPRLGLFEVSVKHSMEILDQGGLIQFFPEAEAGNFKPFTKRYELQPFKPGFARVALAANAPIVPVVIIGGEEANPSLGVLRTKETLGVDLPIPLNLVPFPVKWRIAFLPPVYPDRYLEGDVVDVDLGERIAMDLRDAMQKEIRIQLDKRGSAVF